MEILQILILVTGILHWGITQKYSSEEIIALNLIRPLVNQSLYRGYMRKDVYLITFLRASNFEIQEASEMILKTMSWRQEHRIDDIVNEEFLIEKEFPYDLSGVDREGRPIFNVKIGHWDIRKVALSGRIEEVHRTVLKMVERVANLIRHYAKMYPNKLHNITQVTGLLDMSGYAWKVHACSECINLFQNLLKDIEAHWPQICVNLLFFNSPRIFEVSMTILKAFMDDSMKNGINTFGYDREEYTRGLLKFIAPNELQKVLGKTSVDYINTVISSDKSTKSHHHDQHFEKILHKKGENIDEEFFEKHSLHTGNNPHTGNSSSLGLRKYTNGILVLSVVTTYSNLLI